MLVKLIVIPSGAGLGALEARACAQLILLHTHRPRHCPCHHPQLPPPPFSGIGEVARVGWGVRWTDWRIEKR